MTAIEAEVESSKVSKMVAKRKDAEVAPVSQVASESAAIIAMIERAARDPAVDVDKMQRLFLMSVEAKANAARTEFLSAFARLQKDLPAVERKGTGHNNKKYARFEDFVATIKPKLAENGFSLSFRLEHTEKFIKVIGVLGHEAGHQEATEILLPADKSGNKNEVQAVGSTISYGKRYVGMTLLGIATEDEDDDGKAAGDGALITDEQAAFIRDKIDEVGADIERFCGFMNVDGIAQIPAKQYDAALVALDAKRRAKK